MRWSSLPLLLALGSAPLSAQGLGEAGEQGTVGVACGRVTADARPLLWKNRDALQRDNILHPFADGKSPYLGLCDAGNTTLVRGGANAAGFCIVDAESPDLAQGATSGPTTGELVKLALQRCVTVDDFAVLLLATNTAGRRTQANFGVIDGNGGAAIFEAAHATFTRFDADQAPGGVLVRTNFATTAKGELGRERFVRAEAICSSPASKAMSHQFVLQQFLRDLRAPASATKGDAGTQDVRETVHRQTTVAALVCHGIKAKEDPRLTTMWVLLGQPLFSIAVPCWPAAGGAATELCGYPRSALCDVARQLQDLCHLPVGEAGSVRWLLTARLLPVRRDILFAEADILARTAEKLEVWQREPPTPDVQRAFHAKVAKLARERLAQLVARTAVPAGK